MGVTTTLLLAALVGAAPAARPRLVLLPLASDAPAAEQQFFNAVALAAQASPGLTWLPWPVRAAAPESAPAALDREIEATLTAVQAAYRRLDTDEAARRLNTLENAQLNLLGCPERISLAAKISFWLGVVYAANKSTERAAERFAAVLAIDPAYPIDATYFPPQTVALFEKVRKGLGATPTGGLSISGEPDAAAVFLDGKSAGRAPLTLNAPAGDHFVCVRRPGWLDWAARLKLTAGRVETQRIFLQRASPAVVGQQVVALFGGKPATLEDPARIQTLADALSVDVIVAIRGRDTLTWRLATDPDRLHEAQATDAEAPAGQVLAELERSVGAAPSAPVPVAPAVVSEAPRFSLDLGVHAGGGVSLIRGGMVGGRLGFFFDPHPLVGIGIQAGAAKGLGSVPLTDPGQPAHPLLAVAGDAFEVPAALTLRWTVVGTERLRVFLAAGLGIRLLLCSPALPVPTEPPAPMIVLPPAPPMTLILVGPHLGAGTVFSINKGTGVFVGVEYGLEFQATRSTVQAVLMTRTNPPTVMASPLLAPEPLLNAVSVDLGMQWRF